MDADVVVIGAGVAGLACARALAALGATVVIVEARDRLGGRISTLRFPDAAPVELGAQVVHGERAATWDVIREAHLSVAPFSPAGDMVFSVEGRLWSVADVARTGTLMPWLAENMLTGIPAADRSVREVFHDLGVDRLGSKLSLEWLTQKWCANPAELSTAGIKRVQEAWQAGSGEFTILDGYDRIPHQLALGLDVRLESPAELVHWRRGRVVVETMRDSIAAEVAVLTIPPSVIVTDHPRFDPLMPEDKIAAARSIGTGGAVVLVACLAEPSPQSRWVLVVGEYGGFWRADAGSNLLVGWSKGPAAARTAREATDGKFVARLVGAAFPWIRADSVVEVRTIDWGADPYARGGYTFPRTKSLDASARWASPVENTLFFAGEATCGDRHPGMVHGAIESGLRAAAEVARLTES